MGQIRSSNSGGHKIVKEIVEVNRVNKSKKVKWIFNFKNKLIVFTYYLKLFFTLCHAIKLFYQTYLIYLMT